ncbi:MAG: DUF3182 family protein [Pseudomonadota bacterium]|nr:DUF3182 family protein [Pseudomonadota bacterium]
MRAKRTLYVLPATGFAGANDHTAATCRDLAARLAVILDHHFGGELERGEVPAPGAYFVPGATLHADQASALGIRSENDLLGGVVPRAFLATKTISHAAIGPEAVVPEGWSHDLARALGDAVLPGYSAFSMDEARVAGRRLLPRGAVRVKLASGVGGSDQHTVVDGDGLDVALAGFVPGEVRRHGVVLELALDEAVAYSIGQLRVAGECIAYHGVQHNVVDARGREVYGGSELTVVRGNFDALLQLSLPSSLQHAVERAIRYDRAVSAAYPGILASRRNYDVVAGIDADGASHCGVLEQSWRIGGATPAELAALAAFRADPERRVVRASCHEAWSHAPPPAGATVHYRGDDGVAGMVCKYSLVEEPA